MIKTDPKIKYELVENLKTRMGVHILVEGSYSGEVINDLPHGLGRFINIQDEIWEGQYFEGKYHGFMRMIGPVGNHTVGRLDMS